MFMLMFMLMILRTSRADRLAPQSEARAGGENDECDERIEPVVVRGDDDGQERDDRMCGHEPSPFRLAELDGAPANEKRPPEMQGRHCRDLVADAIEQAVSAVGAWTEQSTRVDETELGEHSRRCQWVRDVKD